MILRVGDHLGDKDLSHLFQGNRYLSELLSQSLLKRALEDKPPRIVKVHALSWAIDYGHAKLAKTIVSQPDFSPGKVHDALYQAAAMGNCDIISILIDAGYRVSDPWSVKYPLHACAMNGHPGAVQLLLDHGATIGKKDENDMTAFELALRSPRQIFQQSAPQRLSRRDELQLIYDIDNRVVSTLRILVQNGARQELLGIDRGGNTTLHRAVAECLGSVHDLRAGTGVLQFLVDQGVSLSLVNVENDRPIEVAILYGSAGTTSLNFFLAIGVSANSTDVYGASLLANAILCDQPALPVIEMLLKRGARTDDIQLLEFFEVTECTDHELIDRILNLLLVYGVRFGDDASKCFTLAAIHGSLDAMKVVFETGGVDINTFARQKGGQELQGTPLQIAIMKKRTDMLEFLVANGVEMSQNQQIEVQVILGEPTKA